LGEKFQIRVDAASRKVLEEKREEVRFYTWLVRTSDG
jgi:hypothetical protein